MARILVVDDMAIFRDPLSASLRAAGYQTETANDGREGLTRARAKPPDLILLDVAMPRMSGLEMVEALRREARFKALPVILLTALADRATILKAAEVGIKDYLLKSRFSMTEMLDRVQRLLARGSGAAEGPRTASGQSIGGVAKGGTAESALALPVLLTREQSVSRVERASARPLGGVVTQVLSMAGCPTVEMSDLATLIGRDPALSARVIRAANSAAFAGARKVVTSIQEAVRNVGVSAVRNLATALSVYEAVPSSASGGAGGFHHIRSWQHSFAAALVCQHLAVNVEGVDPSAAYLVGLCHDLGQIMFRTEFAPEYVKVLKAQADTGLPLVQAERQMLGMTQLDLVRIILRQMSLPERIHQPIEEFHTQAASVGRQRKEPPAETARMARILYLADQYANGMLMAAYPTSEVGPLTKEECQEALGREDPRPPDVEQLRGQILALTPLLARLPEAEERNMCKPLLPPTGKPVWLAREGAFSSFDPLAVALGSLGEARIETELPGEEARQTCGAIVVAATQRGPLELAAPLRGLRIALEEVPAGAAKEGDAAIMECGRRVSLARLATFIGGPARAVRKAA